MTVSDYLDKSQLTAQLLPEADVQLAVGKVRVRGLSRGEVFAMQKAKESGGLKDIAAWERRMVSLGMVAPELTEADVAEWQNTELAGGGLEKVTNAISELSGLNEGAEKQAMASFRDDAGDGVRVLPGGEAGDDGGPAAGVDEQ